MARVAHDVLVRAEIALETATDQLRPAPTARSALLDDLTLVVKTYERPRVVSRLVHSIRRHFPDVRILLVDDSSTPSAPPGVELVPMPHASGVSAGRREGLRRVSTPYTGILDDDFVFTRRTGLHGALEKLAAHPEIDILAGRVVNLPLYREVDYGAAPLYPGARPGVLPAGTMIDGLEVLPKVPNFYVARTERLRLVDWDPQLRRVEHADFFSRASGVLVSAIDPDLRVLHARTPFDTAYMRDRMDFAGDAALLASRWRSS